MGTRRKQAVSVYVDPASPLAEHLKRFKDKSGEMVRLAAKGLLVEQGPEAASKPVVTFTDTKTNVTELKPVSGVGPAVNVTRPKPPAEFDPGWDE